MSDVQQTREQGRRDTGRLPFTWAPSGELQTPIMFANQLAPSARKSALSPLILILVITSIETHLCLSHSARQHLRTSSSSQASRANQTSGPWGPSPRNYPIARPQAADGSHLSWWGQRRAPRKARGLNNVGHQYQQRHHRTQPAHQQRAASQQPFANSRSLKADERRMAPIPQVFTRPPAPGQFMGPAGEGRGAIVRLLPKGPQPYRPSSILLSLNSFGLMEKLKQTRAFKRMYKSKVYYLFLDVLQQLVGLVDKLAKQRLDATGSKVAAVQAIAGKLLLKGGQQLKLNWPLVMLNPLFIKELLANPTFLVMLFHAIETAYMSTPAGLWLKPLIKLVKQPSGEKEEEVWWRRKRIYEVLNGPGSSEAEPSLKAAHFRRPGEPAPARLSGFVQTLRQMTGRPRQTQHDYYNQAALQADLQMARPPRQRPPPEVLIQRPLGQQEETLNVESGQDDALQALPMDAELGAHEEPVMVKQNALGQLEPADYLTGAQEKAFLANQLAFDQRQPPRPHAPPSAASQEPSQSSAATSHQHEEASADWQMDNALAHSEPGGGANELMSQREFDMLDPEQRELVLRETRRNEKEARLAEELIRQQSELVESFAHRPDGTLILPPGLVGR